MCGIAGFSGNYEYSLLGKMNDAQMHRGPDDEGVWFDGENMVGLAHRRLSIQDTSAAGKQPMWDAACRALICFNGEIYNFRQLRETLRRSGVRFNSKTDSEVLVNLYLLYGESMFDKIDGIYSFAIWDKQKKILLIARDSLGVKPLYYVMSERGFLFASEIKALILDSQMDRRIDEYAVAYHLTYLWSPSPTTMFKNVHKLNPGTAIVVKNGKIKKEFEYYRLPQGRTTVTQDKCMFRTADEAEKVVHDSIESAVKKQMISDVPVGAFLSGGLDSSSIAYFARKYTPDRLQCYTIEFSGNSARGEGFVEDLPYAKKVAKFLDVDLNIVTVGPEIADNIESMVYQLDEPLADPAPLNTYFISKLARSQGIKVLLSGAGGDDILSGYRRHFALQQERYWSGLPKYIRQAIAMLTGKLPAYGNISRRIRKAFEYAGLDQEDRLISYFFWQRPEKVLKLLHPDLRNELNVDLITKPITSLLSNCGEISALERMLYIESKYFLADLNLNYTDKMSMAAGVEVRVPLIDTSMIEVASRIPSYMKQHGSTGKWIFKKAMESCLPHDIIYRPKSGFGLPIRSWLRNELKPLLHDVLSESSLKNRGLFNSVEISKLIKMNQTGKVDATYTLLSLICIELWCRKFCDV